MFYVVEEKTMWYRGSITVAANTLILSPATQEIEVCKGVIERFYRLFPLGCSGMVHLQIWHQEHQLFPASPGASYIGDESEILGDASINLDEPPFVLELRAWSPGTTYQHIVYVEFFIRQVAAVLYPEMERESVPIPIF